MESIPFSYRWFRHPRRDENSYKPKTVQLLEVEKKNGKYLFDFSKLEVFIDIAIKCG